MKDFMKYTCQYFIIECWILEIRWKQFSSFPSYKEDNKLLNKFKLLIFPNLHGCFRGPKLTVFNCKSDHLRFFLYKSFLVSCKHFLSCPVMVHYALTHPYLSSFFWLLMLSLLLLSFAFLLCQERRLSIRAWNPHLEARSVICFKSIPAQLTP